MPPVGNTLKPDIDDGMLPGQKISQLTGRFRRRQQADIDPLRPLDLLQSGHYQVVGNNAGAMSLTMSSSTSLPIPILPEDFASFFLEEKLKSNSQLRWIIVQRLLPKIESSPVVLQ